MKSLCRIKIDMSEYVWDKLMEINDMNIEWQAYADWSVFPSMLNKVDAYSLSDRWYERFSGGSVWFGILSHYPWYQLEREEEEIWQILIDYHMEVKGAVVRYKHNSESPLNKWLRRHAGDGDVPYNVDTLFYFVARACIDLDFGNDYSKMLQWEQEVICQECGLAWYGLGPHDKCPECEKEIGYVN